MEPEGSLPFPEEPILLRYVAYFTLYIGPCTINRFWKIKCETYFSFI